jgi:hypothetical protein
MVASDDCGTRGGILLRGDLMGFWTTSMWFKESNPFCNRKAFGGVLCFAVSNDVKHDKW